VAKLVFLDSEPLWLACKPAGLAIADACRTWLYTLEMTGVQILVPEIVDYEVRRELIRRGATAGLRRLDGFLGRFNLLPLDRPALLRAAELWAHLRNTGVPTADRHALDADAILVGQAQTAAAPGDVVIVATSNIRHFGRFPGIDARPWTTIT
jgi:predicted nucleic acid-binding protein